jgi:hypothetical protein
MKTQISLIATMLAAVFIIACKKEKVSNPTPLQAKMINDLPADTIIGISPIGQPYGSGKFTLYSFETDQIILNSDSATAKWDIGFRGATIITNSGTGGPANGGAFIWIGNFTDLKEIPADSIFRTDNAPAAYAIPAGSGNGWYNYNGGTQLLTPIPGRVLVFRTANSRYVKVEILNYYKGGITPDPSSSDAEKISKQRYYTFRYIYQPDGSKKF